MSSIKRRYLVVLVLYCLLYAVLAVYSERWLLRETDGRIADDFGIYYQAYLRARAGENPFSPYKIGLSFVYHPFALTWVSLFDWNGVKSAAVLWMSTGVIAWVASLVLAIRLLLGDRTLQESPLVPRAWIWLATFVMLAFAPLGESIHVGQINSFVVLCLVLTYYGAERPGLAWETGSAVALSLAILFKTSPLVLIFYFVVMRRYRLVLLTILSIIILSAVTAIQFSPDLLFQFAGTILRIGSGIHYATYNQSALRIAWQLLQSLGISGVDGWLVRIFQLISFLLFVVSFGSAWLSMTSRTPARLALFNLLLGLMVVASPIVWYHHNTLLLLPILALILHSDRRFGVAGLVALLFIQSERALEATGLLAGFSTGLAALAGQIIILFAYITLYGRDRWPVLRRHLAQHSTLWRRYSGDV